MMNTLKQLRTSIRVAAVTMLICSGFYTFIVLAMGQILVPDSANGSIIRNEQGEAIGSKLVSQNFTRPEYLWPRSSAVNYNAAATGGSNFSPVGEMLRENALTRIKKFGDETRMIIPADLATTSGSGLDPHITEKSALFQADRIAQSRAVDRASIEEVIKMHIVQSGWIPASEPLVNVLQVNVSLDKMIP